MQIGVVQSYDFNKTLAQRDRGEFLGPHQSMCVLKVKFNDNATLVSRNYRNSKVDVQATGDKPGSRNSSNFCLIT